MKNKPIMPEYYNLPTWIIREFGFSREMGAYLIIYNFYRQGKICYYSKSQWAQLLSCTQMQAIRILRALEAENYIISERRKDPTGKSCLSTVYRINEETAQELQTVEPSNMDVTTPSNMDVTTPSNMDVTTPSNMDVTTPSNMDVTQSEYINQNIYQNNKSGGESARAQNAEPLISIHGHEAVKLTQRQYSTLQNDVDGTGKSLECYFRNLERSMKSKGKSYEPHFETLRSWIQEDKDSKAEQSSKAKPEAAEDSSIDMQLLEKIMYGDFGAAEDPAQDARTAPQSRRPADGPTLPRS